MRIALFIDGPNFFFLQKNRLQWWIDPAKLLEWLREQGTVTEATYYLAVSDASPAQESFMKALAFMGYSVFRKPVRISPDGVTRRHTSVENEIILDMLNTTHEYDKAVLISGSPEFERVLECLRCKGKQFQVISTVGFSAHSLQAFAGPHYLDIEDLRKTLEKSDQSNRYDPEDDDEDDDSYEDDYHRSKGNRG